MGIEELELKELKLHMMIHDRVVNRAAPVDVIITSACLAVGIRTTMFHIKTRKREVVMARQLAMMYAVSNLSFEPMNYEEIGKTFGGKDHATVTHAVRTCSNLKHTNNKEYLQVENDFLASIRLSSSEYGLSMTPKTMAQRKIR